MSNDIVKTITEVNQRLNSFQDRPHRHWPRWTITDYAKVGILASDAETSLGVIEQLRARVAELEGLLNLPEGWELYHSGATDEATLYEVHIWENGECTDYFGPTPEAALEAARKEQTPCPKCHTS